MGNNNFKNERTNFNTSLKVFAKFINDAENLEDKQVEWDNLLEKSKTHLKTSTDFYNNFDRYAIIFESESKMGKDKNKKFQIENDCDSAKIYSRRAFCYMNIFQNIFITPLTLKINDRSTKESLRWARKSLISANILFVISTILTAVSILLTIYFSYPNGQEIGTKKDTIILIEEIQKKNAVQIDSISKRDYLHNNKANKDSILIKK